ncbi:MAG TPA: TlpA disulfide reductase family protein [Candidatus Polarisedimenticolia bacterium]|nr:TlpA disulfide reductase family protein [Candidatus Polarisedimenticolia bacterium]
MNGTWRGAAALAAFNLLWALGACSGGAGRGGGARAGIAVPAGRAADEAPDPTLAVVMRDPQGRDIRFADFGGKVRVLDLWATWCGPCRMGIPHLNALYDRYRDRGVVVVGISVDDSPADVATFLHEIPMRYPNGMINPQIRALLGDPSSIPVTLILDQSGRLRQKFVGLVDTATLEESIRGLLAPS